MTNHSKIISDLRETSAIIERAFKRRDDLAAVNILNDARTSRAAADLLELHDRTGLNLHEAPGLLEFVNEEIRRAINPDFEGVENNHV